jgi:hypothetical protein
VDVRLLFWCCYTDEIVVIGLKSVEEFVPFPPYGETFIDNSHLLSNNPAPAEVSLHLCTNRGGSLTQLVDNKQRNP